ncbi:MFS transporter [Actinotalea sp. M2MS4P-6]|uniref:MFS transporter n=1 Tax=Actinotalea sp. M2MS4P-6 TaxID=2983762 RepID=UPI0021E4AA87|nr:MFS transporter [Actinotalea sp. M2MS4P-6]MCV2396410.1 MFS transporter [Actinotalea sp. M2MS4P-6]
MTRVRGLLILLSAAMVVDTAGYSAITPLLPHFVDTYGLGRVGAGLLAAAYPLGTVGLALPAAWLVARVGPKRVTLLSLTLLGAASLGFALATTAPLLALARLAQGCGAAGLWSAALAWAIAIAPAGRRAEVIGTVTGAAIVGAVGGPVLGVLGDLIGIRTVFLVFVAVPAVLGALVARRPAPPTVARASGLRDLVRAAHDGRVRLGVWLMVVPSIGFGVIALLVPLRLDARGWTAAGIGAVFLVAAVTEALASPVAGRAADRYGPHVPGWVALAASGIGLALLAPRWGGGPASAWTIAVLVPLTGAVLGSLWTPAMTLLTHGAEDGGVDPAFGFGMANLSWGVGTGIGNLAGGGVAEIAGDWAAFALVAAVAAGSAVAVRRMATPRVREL